MIFLQGLLDLIPLYMNQLMYTRDLLLVT